MRIIFVCHDASRTGAPLLLLQLIRWFKVNHSVEAFIILLKGGPLENEFRKEGEVFLWKKTRTSSGGNNLTSKLLSKLANIKYGILRNYQLKSKIRYFRADTIYLSTVAVLMFLHDSIHLFKAHKKILHCHEMEHTISRYVPDSLECIFSSMDKIIVVNENIRQYFLRRDIPSERLLRVSEYLVKKFATPAPKTDPEMFKIVGAGVGSWRKGIDLFILCAYYFSKIYSRPFSFSWVGPIQAALFGQIVYDIKQLGLTDHVKLVGEVPDIGDHINNCDIFFLSSREDPYPVVMLEAAWFEKPILYFENTGGASEFVNDKELGVSAFDIHEAANRLKFYAENEQIRKEKGDTLKKRALSHTVENVGKTIFEFIQRK